MQSAGGGACARESYTCFTCGRWGARARVRHSWRSAKFYPWAQGGGGGGGSLRDPRCIRISSSVAAAMLSTSALAIIELACSLKAATLLTARAAAVRTVERIDDIALRAARRACETGGGGGGQEEDYPPRDAPDHPRCPHDGQAVILVLESNLGQSRTCPALPVLAPVL